MCFRHMLTSVTSCVCALDRCGGLRAPLAFWGAPLGEDPPEVVLYGPPLGPASLRGAPPPPLPEIPPRPQTRGGASSGFPTMVM